MTRRSSSALVMVVSLIAGGLTFSSPAPVEAQCLDRAACREIRAEFAKLKPDLRAARKELQRLRRALRALPKGSDRWLARREEAKDARKALRALKRELNALRRDFRYQGCASC